MGIKTMNDFVPLFPNVIQDRSSEWHSACPFCYADGASTETVYNGIHFYGTDRLVWRGGGLWCRRCAAQGRGNTGTGFYTFEQLANKLSADIDGEFDAELNAIFEEDPLRNLWNEGLVQRAHERVDRQYWYNFGWTDDIINRFKLGTGILYSSDGDVNLIPMQVTHISDEEENNAIKDYYYLSGRRQGLPPKRSPGSIRSYYWKIRRSDELSPAVLCIVCEGEKDGITMAYLFPQADIFVAFGATSWSKNKTEALNAMGYKDIWLVGDNDSAGQLMSHNGALWATLFGMQAYTLHWGELFDNKFDVTDLLQTQGFAAAKEYILNNLVLNTESADAGVTRAVYMSDIQDVIDYSQIEFTTLDDLRGDGEKSLYGKIQEYINNYPEKRQRRGILQLLQSPPGSGKTHTLIRVAEELSREEIIKKTAEKLELEAAYLSIQDEVLTATDYETKAELQKLAEKIKYKIDNFSFASIAWYGQYKDMYTDLLATGADENLWFNFEARNPDNCVNYDTVTKLANNNHNIGEYCNSVCPFKRECMKSGYLSQDTERKKKPITFFRFQHLMNQERAAEYTRLNVIDENPGGLVDNSPVVFKSIDVQPFTEGWELDIEDRNLSNMVELFTSAVRNSMNQNAGQSVIISGAAFLKLVDQSICGTTNNGYNLQSVMEGIDETLLMNYYQPTFMGGDINEIRRRCVPQLYATLLRELPDYVQNPDNKYPSCIHLVNGELELYAQHILKFSSNVPVIVADATALPLLYDAMFKREVEVYAPRIKNNNAQIMVIHGSDWTKGQISKEIGRQLSQFKSQEMLEEGIYDKRIVRDAIAIISGLASKHTSLLVVTHKNIRELFEKLMEGKFENIVWGHYGALRGSNAYTDYEAVALIGAFRIPYDVMYRRISAWAWLLGLRDEFTTETVIKPMAYDGQTTGHGYRTFENWFADAFVNMVEQGELIQSAERIRPHATDKKKYVYIVASRPALTYVTDVITKNEFMKQFLETKEKELASYMREYYNTHNAFPSYGVVTDKFGVSNTTVNNIRQKLQGELQ